MFQWRNHYLKRKGRGKKKDNPFNNYPIKDLEKELIGKNIGIYKEYKNQFNF